MSDYGVVPNRLLTFLRFFFSCNAEFSPCWALPEYIRALVYLACLRVFSVTLWVIVYRLYRVRWQGQSNWFWKITLNPLKVMEYRVSKASNISFSYHSIHTSPTVDWYLLQLTFHEIWHLNTKWSYLKVPEIKSYILSRGHSVCWRIFSLAVCLSKRYTKVPEAVFVTVFATSF